MNKILNFIFKYLDQLIMCITEPVDDNYTNNDCIHNLDIKNIQNIQDAPVFVTYPITKKSDNIDIPIENNIHNNIHNNNTDNIKTYSSNYESNESNFENNIHNNNIDNIKTYSSNYESNESNYESNESNFENNFKNNFENNFKLVKEITNIDKKIKESNEVESLDSNEIIYTDMKTTKLETIKSENNIEDIGSDISSHKSYCESVKKSLKKFEDNYESDIQEPSKYFDSDLEFNYSSDYMSNDEIVNKYLEKKSNYQVSESDITCSETEMKNTCNRLHKKIIRSYNLNDSIPNNYQTKHRRQLQNLIKDLNNSTVK